MRILDEIKKNYQFVPATCNGENVKSKLHVNYNYRIGDQEFPLVEIKNAKTVNPLHQMVTMNHASEKGGVGFEYRSNMNVPSEVIIKNPEGKRVFEKTYPYMYKKIRDYTMLERPIKGEYTITVIQDGIETTSKMDVTVFEK